MITAGGTPAFRWGAERIRDGGMLHSFAGGEGPVLPLPPATLYHRELTITATYSSSPAELAEAFRLLATGEVTVDGLITHRVPLAGLAEGVELMRGRRAVKVYVTP
jgi:L-iditol 2-dehydrogenase